MTAPLRPLKESSSCEFIRAGSGAVAIDMGRGGKDERAQTRDTSESTAQDLAPSRIQEVGGEGCRCREVVFYLDTISNI